VARKTGKSTRYEQRKSASPPFPRQLYHSCYTRQQGSAFYIIGN